MMFPISISHTLHSELHGNEKSADLSMYICKCLKFIGFVLFSVAHNTTNFES
jgi:hypothetical protein